MRQLRELLRLRLQAELSMRQIIDSLRISLGAVQNVINKAEAQELNWAAIEQLDDQQLARLFYPEVDTRVSAAQQLPDWVEMHQVLRRKGVTKHLRGKSIRKPIPIACSVVGQRTWRWFAVAWIHNVSECC